MLSYLRRYTFAFEITGAILLSRSGKEGGGEKLTWEAATKSAFNAQTLPKKK